MNGKKLVAWNLRRLRVARGQSQEALAADAGIDRTYVSRLERGLENPTVAVLEKLGGALSHPLSAFFVVPPDGFTKINPLPGGPSGRKPKLIKKRKAK